MTLFAAAVRRRDSAEVLDSFSQNPAHLVLSEAGISLCASARIDNHRELASLLGLPPEVPLDRLLLAGWRTWETDLADRLRGVFALVIRSAPEGLLCILKGAPTTLYIALRKM